MNLEWILLSAREGVAGTCVAATWDEGTEKVSGD